MRKLFILLVIGLFALYMYGVSQNFMLRNVPKYKAEKIDLLGGKTPQAWNSDDCATFREKHLSKLEEKRYQCQTEGLTIAGVTYTSETILKKRDYKKMIGENPKQPIVVTLRNPAAIYAFAKNHYELRDTVAGQKAGVVLSKEVLDHIIASPDKISRISIIGHGDVVSFQLPSMIMVMLIFMALLFALKIVLWGPLLQIIDSRKKEIEKGASLVNENINENDNLVNERKKRLGEMRKEYLANLSEIQGKAREEADVILDAAHKEVHQIRVKANRELAAQIEKAEKELRAEIPEFSRQIVAQILNRAS